MKCTQCGVVIYLCVCKQFVSVVGLDGTSDTLKTMVAEKLSSLGNGSVEDLDRPDEIGIKYFENHSSL